MWSHLANASWDELRTRAAQEVAKRWDSTVYRLIARRNAGGGSPFSAGGRFYFDPEEVPAIVRAVSQRLPGTVEQIHRSAEEICGHSFHLLGYESLKFGKPIDWHLDPVSGKPAPRIAFHKIQYLEYAEVGDVKVTWELNRHQHLVTLAKAYCFTGDQRFVRELVDQWYSWKQQNPYPIGVNWVSSLEVAFRALSWLWIRRLLGQCDFVNARFWPDLDKLLLVSGRHIERYLSTYFAPNTHLLGEGVALFSLGTLCGNSSDTRRWKQAGWDIVLREAERQVLADGMHFEQSTYYHVYALDFFLHARIMAERNCWQVPQSLDDVIKKMLGALTAIGGGGVPPRFGDDDGGRAFDPRRNRPEHLLDPLATGAVFYRCPEFKIQNAALVEETLWLLGAGAVEQFDSLPFQSSLDRPISLPSSGIYQMHMTGGYRLTMDAGPQGARGAGHGHADALSIQVALNGKDILTDPGTCVYVSGGDERMRFRGTAAHNTLQVDQRDQADVDGPFRWGRLPAVRVERSVAGESFTLLIASHTGYERLSDPVLHRRAVFQVNDELWFVLDLIEGSTSHDLSIAWHLAPEHEWAQDENVILVGGKPTLALIPEAATGWSQIITDDFVSPVYGIRLSARTLFFKGHCALPAAFGTVLSPARSIRTGILKKVEDAAGHEQPHVYRYDAGAEHHLFICNQGAQIWRWRNLVSDAAFTYFGANDSGKTVLFLAGCSHFEVGTERVLRADHAFERIEIAGEGATVRISPQTEAVTPEPALLQKMRQELLT